MRKTIAITILLLFVTGAWIARGVIRDAYENFTKEKPPEPQQAVSTTNSPDPSRSVKNNEEPTNGSPANTNTQQDEPLPVEANLDVPFTSQAPLANWDLPYQEACEEAAALMVHRFWQDKPFTSKEEADLAIREIVDFEEKKYGDYKDTTAKETAQFIRDLWDYQNIDVYSEGAVTIDRIKKEVALGFPVIVLAAGRQLGNPNFRSPGPIYHALVVKGYTKKGQLITNDPGTRKGADYLYDPSVLFEAIHDWNDGDVEKGQKVMVVVRGQ